MASPESNYPEVERTPHGPMVWVPLPYFDMLCRSYYQQDQEQETVEVMTSPEVEVVGQPPGSRMAFVTNAVPDGFTPRGAALRRAGRSVGDQPESDGGDAEGVSDAS